MGASHNLGPGGRILIMPLCVASVRNSSVDVVVFFMSINPLPRGRRRCHVSPPAKSVILTRTGLSVYATACGLLHFHLSSPPSHVAKRKSSLFAALVLISSDTKLGTTYLLLPVSVVVCLYSCCCSGVIASHFFALVLFLHR